MKAKTIKAILRKKVNEWAATIDDEDLRELVLRDTIITGGAIASLLLKEKVNDFDVYFRTRDTALKVATYYVDKFVAGRKVRGIEVPLYVEDGQKFDIMQGERTDRIRIVAKSAGVAKEGETKAPYEYFEMSQDSRAAGYIAEVMDNPADIEEAFEATSEIALEEEDKDYRPIFLSTNAITLSNRIQIVIRFFGEPDEIHENYDFVHCTNYWTSKGEGNLVLRPEALEALLTKELRYIGSKYPICSIIRLRKFMGRGWTINAGQILKMCMQVSELDLTSVAVLEDQLTGVDTAYFVQLIHRLKEKNPEKLDAAYLVEIIDRLF